MEGHNCHIKTFGFILLLVVTVRRNFPCDSVVKNPPAKVGDAGLKPGLGMEEGRATHSSILAWKIPWTEDPVRLQSVGSQELDTT